ncbi:ATP-binding protein [Mangrovibrevibacter kandeliae]|uniref:ATP-binding protein n=1 Tax=Mangrovibrevibacter kandeliae TaxID=2968473 RepID=UPI0021199DA1|nr:ATP-binding protein [Aurantimonas sp. CSK15Z-1]MCQ8782853.1 ATP-binding protein [Aurantimonas sp. CSK15Z-1]
MSSLRNRLAVLLVGAIVAVVALAALVTVQMLDRPDRRSFIEDTARRIAIAVDALRASPGHAADYGIELAGAPPPAEDWEPGGIKKIRAALGRLGRSIDLRVVRRGPDRQLAVEYDAGRWALLPDFRPPPPSRFPLVAYLGLVTFGAIGISLVVATRMTRPLRLLDEAVRSLGPDGLPQHVPEEGPLELRTTAAAINRLSHGLKTAIESRMRLVAAAGHDLRTPMTRMRLRAEFLPDEEREVWLRDLEELDHIADSAIRLVREEVDPSVPMEVELAGLLAEIRAELGELGRPVELQAPVPVRVAAMPMALKRALRNLVDNAATHGGGACVRLSCDGGKALVVIEDDGPGIPDDLLGRAFEPFFRVDPARMKRYPGAGLGLAIAREIVERAGGGVTLRNREAGGLLQEVRLPLASSDAN